MPSYQKCPFSGALSGSRPCDIAAAVGHLDPYDGQNVAVGNLDDIVMLNVLIAVDTETPYQGCRPERIPQCSRDSHRRS